MRLSVHEIAAAAGSIAQQSAARVRLLLGIHGCVVRLFFGEDRKLKPDALRWVADLAHRNHVLGSAFHSDPREHARREGRRELAIEIIASMRLDPVRLSREIERLREDEQ